MDGDPAVDLVPLTDGEGRLLVRVPGRHMRDVPPWHGFPEAEITVTSGFAQGRRGGRPVDGRRAQPGAIARLRVAPLTPPPWDG